MYAPAGGRALVQATVCHARTTSAQTAPLSGLLRRRCKRPRGRTTRRLCTCAWLTTRPRLRRGPVPPSADREPSRRVALAPTAARPPPHGSSRGPASHQSAPGWRVRTNSAQSRASVTAAARSACGAVSCPSCCSASGGRVSGRRSTRQAAPRGVRWPCWGSATTGRGCATGGGWRGASPGACRHRWA